MSSARVIFRRTVLAALAVAFVAASAQAQEKKTLPDRLNPEVVGINNLAPRSIFAATAYKQHSLDGDWKFSLAPTPEDVPFNFEAESKARPTDTVCSCRRGIRILRSGSLKEP